MPNIKDGFHYTPVEIVKELIKDIKFINNEFKNFHQWETSSPNGIAIAKISNSKIVSIKKL